MDLSLFETRKKDHLELALRPEMQATHAFGWSSVRLDHDALPELDFSEVRLNAPFLSGEGKLALATPFFVSGMTAGHEGARELNTRLARVSARRGWIFGVGSQRRELGAQDSADRWDELNRQAPGLVSIGNVGLSQAIREDVASLRRLAEGLEASAFCVHLNALQEAIQPEGTPEFRGGVEALARLSETLGIPLIVKETGCGFSAKALSKLSGIRLAAVDVSGSGGTHWGRIEGARAMDSVRIGAAETFANWGVPTPESVRMATTILSSNVEVWASGGVRSGLDAAKAIALGASRVGFAKPALEAALQGEKELDAWMERVEYELKTALFCTGCASIEALRGSALEGGAK